MNSRIAPWFSFSLNFPGKIPMTSSHYERIHQLEEKAPKITNRSNFFSVPTSCQLQPYSKPAVNRQPGFRRKDSSSLLPCLNLPYMNLKKKTEIFKKSWKSWKSLNDTSARPQTESFWEAFGSHLGELEADEPSGGNLDVVGGISGAFGILEASERHLGSIREASGRHLGSIWVASGHLGSGKHLGGIWEASGKHLGSIWETSWEHLGIWDLGSICDASGKHLRASGIWETSGEHLGIWDLGSIWEASLGIWDLGGIWEASGKHPP